MKSGTIKSIGRSLMLATALAVLPAAVVLVPATAAAGVFVSVNIAPPALPVYEQPLCPGDGYIWTPGYWAWDPDEGSYYWVPGTWVLAPQPGYLWTPGYWGWGDGVYLWHPGYWGLHVGFYGGINYGFGYGGEGYQGGYWNDGRFNYNRSVNNVNVTNIHNTYNTTVVNNTTVNNVSYNGGSGGTVAQPSQQQRQWAGEHHIQPTSMQVQHAQAAAGDPSQHFNNNHGNPGTFATARPGVFHGAGAVTHGTPAAAGPPQAGPQGHAQGFQPGQQHAPAAGGFNGQNAPHGPGQPQLQPNLPQHNNPLQQAQPRYQQPQGQPHYNQPQQNQPRYQQPQAQPHYNQPQQGQPHYQQPQAQPHYNQPQYSQPRPQQYSQPQYSQPRPQPQFNEPRPQFNEPRPQPQFNEPRPQPQFSQPHPQPQPQQQRGPQHH